MKILFLATRMATGFGVSVALQELSKRLMVMGVDVVIGCEAYEESGWPCEVRKIAPTANAVQLLVDNQAITHVIAHTSPFFELLPHLSGCKRIVWEHGDPDPEFFKDDRAERTLIREQKRRRVYPAIDQVICISEFIRAEIQWPRATVIPNGWEHVLAGPATRPALASANPRLGCLFRLGDGEHLYKGTGLYLELLSQLRQTVPGAELEVLGRGTIESAHKLVKQGIKVHLNASDEFRQQWMLTLDVFVSLSLWEGCNLTLLEAQALGVPSIALDTGAHPEVCPLIATDLRHACHIARRLLREPEEQQRWSRIGQQHVFSHHSWDVAADSLVSLLLADSASVLDLAFL